MDSFLVNVNHMLDNEPPFSERLHAASLARTAAGILERIESGEEPRSRVDSATWRLADALYRLQRYSHAKTPGIGRYTGLGARLDARRKK